MDTLMIEALLMSSPQTSVATLNVISSPVSEDGPTPSNSQDGLQIVPCGPEAALVSHSAQPEKDSLKPTSATSGPCSLNSSVSAALSMSLGSRLRQRLGTAGSMEYRQTWKQKATPAGRPYWAHTASALLTSDSDYTGWPTPVVNDTTGSTHCYSGKNPDGSNKIALKLPGAAKMAGWPTPNAEDAKAGQSQAQNRQQSSLLKTANWVEVVQLSGPLPSGIHAETGKQGVLNPAFSLWLMGYPAEWVCCGERAMLSFPKSRRSS